MKKIICSLVIVLSLNVFGLGALNKNIAQNNEFTKEEQYLIDNGHSMFAEDIRSIRLGNSEAHGTTYENLIKFANDLLLSEVKVLFYEEREENSFTVVTTNTLGHIPIEGFTEAATSAISKITGSIREDYAPGNSNNLDIYVRYNTISAMDSVLEGMLNNEPESFARYISEMGVMYGNSEFDLTYDLIQRYEKINNENMENGIDSSDGIDFDVIMNGNIPGTNNYKYIESAYLNMYSQFYPLEKSGQMDAIEELMWAMNATVREIPLGIMSHERLGWTFVVIELTDRDAINRTMKWQWGTE